jgi:hypothetical protein
MVERHIGEAIGEGRPFLEGGRGEISYESGCGEIRRGGNSEADKAR